VTEVDELVMIGVVVVTGGVVVVTVSVDVVGGVLVGSDGADAGSEGPPPDSPPPAEPAAFDRADPAWPLPDPQLAAAKPTRVRATARSVQRTRSPTPI
jgi:hypothetical protein